MRLFAFGVGYDVDTFLLDSLAQAHHGTITYVLYDDNNSTPLKTWVYTTASGSRAKAS